MTSEQAFIIVAALVAGIAAWTDWRTGHIPNWLTLGTLALAPIAKFVVASMTGQPPVEAAGFSLLGACIVALVPILLYRLKGIYGGDVKLFAALGALCGTRIGVEAELF